jgi:hypothetical protein
MSRSLRLLIALTILLSGLALIPYVGLPSERFGWQQFIMVYGEQPPYNVYLPIIQRETSGAPAPGFSTVYLPTVAR